MHALVSPVTMVIIPYTKRPRMPAPRQWRSSSRQVILSISRFALVPAACYNYEYVISSSFDPIVEAIPIGHWPDLLDSYNSYPSYLLTYLHPIQTFRALSSVLGLFLVGFWFCFAPWLKLRIRRVVSDLFKKYQICYGSHCRCRELEGMENNMFSTKF